MGTKQDMGRERRMQRKESWMEQVRSGRDLEHILLGASGPSTVSSRAGVDTVSSRAGVHSREGQPLSQ